MPSDDGTNVLLLADAADHDATCAACHDLLERTAPTAELRVTFSGADALPGVSDADERSPGRRGLISVGDAARSTARDGPDFSGAVAVDAVPDPTNLRAIGLSVNEFCDRWHDADVAVCVDSLGSFLDHSDPDVVFRFIHVLTERFTNAGANAHFHLDPDEHDDRIVSTFESIFDEVARPEPSVPSLDFEAVIDDDAAGTRDAATTHDARDDADPAQRHRPTADASEATDEDVARIAADWDDDRFAIVEGRRDRARERSERARRTLPTEATDEDIARALDE